jgi:lipid A 3-O-deacylase
MRTLHHRTLLFAPIVLFSIFFYSGLHAEAYSSAYHNDKNSEKIHLEEIGIGSGYGWGGLKLLEDDYKVFPAFLRIGFNVNSLLGIEGRKGTLQIAIEPFVSPVTSPERGYEAGVDIMLRYLHPIASGVKLVSELGAGPMYLSIDTLEQGDAGFDFLNQIGLGLQLNMSEKTALTAGYRFRHISNGGVSHPNTGINTNALVMSFSLLY